LIFDAKSVGAAGVSTLEVRETRAVAGRPSRLLAVADAIGSGVRVVAVMAGALAEKRKGGWFEEGDRRTDNRIGKFAGCRNLQTGGAARSQIKVYNYLENSQ
jgi:hypothetical protein